MLRAPDGAGSGKVVRLRRDGKPRPRPNVPLPQGPDSASDPPGADEAGKIGLAPRSPVEVGLSDRVEHLGLAPPRMVGARPALFFEAAALEEADRRSQRREDSSAPEVRGATSMSPRRARSPPGRGSSDLHGTGESRRDGAVLALATCGAAEAPPSRRPCAAGGSGSAVREARLRGGGRVVGGSEVVCEGRHDLLDGAALTDGAPHQRHSTEEEADAPA